MAGDSIFVNQYSTPEFSHNGERLIMGVARYIAPDDTTIVDFEQPALDIWRWDAPLTPPQELANVKQIRETTLPVVLDLKSGKEVLVTESELAIVRPGDRWDADWTLVRSAGPDQVSQQWDYAAPEELILVNVKTGERRSIGKAPMETADISPAGKYVVWFDNRHYYCYDIQADTTRMIDEGVPYPLWDEEQDIPLQRQSYGAMGATEGDDRILVYDRYDIWSLDPKGEAAPVNLTKEAGRKSGMRYRYRKTDPEKLFFKAGDTVLLDLFDTKTKRNGLATMKIGAPAAPKNETLEEYTFYHMRKAKNAPSYAFWKANFSEAPNVYLAPAGNFAKAQKVTDSNPQQKDYSWGTAQLVDWYAYDGRPSQGVLYVPDDLDPNKNTRCWWCSTSARARSFTPTTPWNPPGAG